MEFSKASVAVERVTPWSLALDLARATVGKKPLGKEPSSTWKTKLVAAEHSPLRAVMFKITFENIPSWVSVHYVRHGKFAEHFVSTQRPDRTGSKLDRGQIPQGALVTHVILTNAAEILAISRKRLCAKASYETRWLWGQVVERLRAAGETELALACRADCAYRGGVCHELQGCGKCPMA